MRIFARFLAVIFAIAFVIATVVVVFFHAVGTRVTQARMYKDVLVQQGLYARFPLLVGDTVTHALRSNAQGAEQGASGEDQFTKEVLGQITPAEWEVLVGAVVPREYLQAEVEQSLDEFFAFLHSGAAGLDGRISLVEVKQRLTGPQFETAYVGLLEGKPPCGQEQIDAARGVPIRCRPTPEQLPQVLDNFRALMGGVAGEMPDEVDPYEELRRAEGPEGSPAELAEVRMRVRQLEWLAPLSPIVPAVLALLIALFAVRSFRGLLLWWGVPCFIAGLIALLVAAPFVFMGSAAFAALSFAQMPPDVPIATAQTMIGLMTGIVRAVMMPALKSAAVLAGGGILAMILASVCRKQPAPPAFVTPQ
jgi:hypothetical protein